MKAIVLMVLCGVALPAFGQDCESVLRMNAEAEARLSEGGASMPFGTAMGEANARNCQALLDEAEAAAAASDLRGQALLNAAAGPMASMSPYIEGAPDERAAGCLKEADRVAARCR